MSDFFDPIDRAYIQEMRLSFPKEEFRGSSYNQVLFACRNNFLCLLILLIVLRAPKQLNLFMSNEIISNEGSAPAKACSALILYMGWRLQPACRI
jgi:hypothetical protein